MDLPRPAEDIHGTAGEDEHAGNAEEKEQEAGHEVEPARAVQEHEADMSPRVGEAAQLRLALAREVVDRDLAHREPAPEGLEHHL